MKIEVDYIEDTVWITDFSKCYCKTVGKDDGDTTCFKHHDCSDGSCTHQDNDDDDAYSYRGDDDTWPSQTD